MTRATAAVACLGCGVVLAAVGMGVAHGPGAGMAALGLGLFAAGIVVGWE